MAKKRVSPRWKYATMALAVVVVGQFVWWDQKCPKVLQGKKGY